MKKIPTLYERIYDDKGKPIGITPNIKPGLEDVFKRCYATRKYDGTAVAFIDGKWMQRYDARKKDRPADFIPCNDKPDPITGSDPGWIPARDKYILEAISYFMENDCIYGIVNGTTFEAVGPKINGNKDHFDHHTLVQHGQDTYFEDEYGPSFEGIKKFLTEHEIEGIVFWDDNGPVCKIKRRDFGIKW